MSGAISFLILAIIVIAIVVILAAYFNQRSSREVSLIRTGLGGRKVALDGSVLAIPYFHDVSRVNMQTLRLEVRRTGESSLITKDRLRVDIGAEFYVSVDPTEEAVDRASQTLGDRTFDAGQPGDQHRSPQRSGHGAEFHTCGPLQLLRRQVSSSERLGYPRVKFRE